MGSNKDKEAFQQAVSGVAPIAQDRVAPYREPIKPVAQQRQRDDAAVMEELLSVDEEDILVESGEALSFSRSGLQHTVLKRLRKGQIAVQGGLDLHGKTVAEAADELVQFIRDAQNAGVRCVRIIHGKGQGSPDKRPVLKSKVNTWLRRKDEVLAFCSAPPNDGGTGAVYVLLRKK